MGLFYAVALFVVGLGLLVWGANFFVTGAAQLASRLGIPKIVVGLTIVAFGTSAPEFAVNLFGAFTGNTNLAIGNIIGSNIANLGLVLGIAAVVTTIQVHSVIISREIPFLFLTSLALLFALVDHRLQPGLGEPLISRGEGLTLLLFFAVYLYYLFAGAIRERVNTVSIDALDQPTEGKQLTQKQSVIYLIGGLVMVTLGGHLVVSNGTVIAKEIGMSDAFVGLVLVAVGTSLPEVATVVTAARRGETDLVLGNIVGSNIFNTVAVLGITATIRPLPYQSSMMQDVAVMFVFSLVAYLVTIHGRKVVRREGIMLLAMYVAYVAFAISRG